MKRYPTSRYTFILALLAMLLINGCSVRHALHERHARNIDSITVVVNYIVTTDVAGTVDVVDLPACKKVATTLADAVTETLESKGYSVAGSYTSISRARKMHHKQRVIEDEGQRELSADQLPIQRGLLYSDSFSEEQLLRLYKSSSGEKHLRRPQELPLDGDAVLFLSIDGRVTGADKKTAKSVANVGLFFLYVVGSALGGGGGGGEFMNVSDIYQIQQGMFMTGKGTILMADKQKTSLKGGSITNFIVNQVTDTVPDHPGHR